MKKTKSKVPFDAKKQRVLAQDLEKVDYSDVVEAAIKHLQSGVHLELSKLRSQFVRTICNHEKPTWEKVVACIMIMILAFIELYKACMVGKRYASFQQEWMENINKYFQVHEEAPEPQNVAAPSMSLTSKNSTNYGIKSLLLYLRLGVRWI
jgi:hypothetical protein